MEQHNEKPERLVERATVEIQQLKQDIKKNAIVLTQLEERFSNDRCSNLDPAVSRNWIHGLLSFVANAPVDILRRMSSRLRLMARSVLLTWNAATSRLPLFLVGDHIIFEDALGRRSRLPFHDFKQTAFFRSYIRHVFKGLPGDYQVQRGQYSLNLPKHKGVFVGEHVWERAVRPGQRLSMFIVSTVPAETEDDCNARTCPGCGALFHQDTALSHATCRQCDMQSIRVAAQPPLYVTPSDGDRNKVSMAAQKLAWAETALESCHTYEVRPDLYGRDTTSSRRSPETSPALHVNHGLGAIKKVLHVQTNEADQLVGAIEDLLDQVCTSVVKASDSGEDLGFRRLRNALRLLREETNRKYEPNLFDFAREHAELVGQTRRIMTSLRSWLDERGRPHASVPNPQHIIQSFVNWTGTLFHAASSSSPDHSIGIATTTVGSRGLTLAALSEASDDDTQISNPSVRTTLVLVRTLARGVACRRVPSHFTIRDFKEALYLREGIPVHQQYLVSQGRKLEDHRTIEDCGLGGSPKWYVHMLLPIWRPQETNAERLKREKISQMNLRRATRSRGRNRDAEDD